MEQPLPCRRTPSQSASLHLYLPPPACWSCVLYMATGDVRRPAFLPAPPASIPSGLFGGLWHLGSRGEALSFHLAAWAFFPPHFRIRFQKQILLFTPYVPFILEKWPENPHIWGGWHSFRFVFFRKTNRSPARRMSSLPLSRSIAKHPGRIPFTPRKGGRANTDSSPKGMYLGIAKPASKSILERSGGSGRRWGWKNPLFLLFGQGAHFSRPPFLACPRTLEIQLSAWPFLHPHLLSSASSPPQHFWGPLFSVLRSPSPGNAPCKSFAVLSPESVTIVDQGTSPYPETDINKEHSYSAPCENLVNLPRPLTIKSAPSCIAKQKRSLQETLDVRIK